MALPPKILPSGKVVIDGETRDVSISELEALLQPETDSVIEISPSGEVLNRDGSPLTFRQRSDANY